MNIEEIDKLLSNEVKKQQSYADLSKLYQTLRKHTVEVSRIIKEIDKSIPRNTDDKWKRQVDNYKT
jgi:hypothetical protein